MITTSAPRCAPAVPRSPIRWASCPVTQRPISPARPNVAEAARITLAVSQENTGVSFGLIATRLVRVTGQVLMSDGVAGDQRHGDAGAGERERAPGHGDAARRRRQSHRSDRHVPLPNVAPGRYQVQARAGGREFELARMDLSVGADDVDGLTLVTGARRDDQRHDRQRHRRAVRFPPAAAADRRAARIAGSPGVGGGPDGARASATTGRSRCAT